LVDQEILTDPYMIEPEKIIEKVIEYIPSPPKETHSMAI
jgi:hypothetical protein